MNRCFWNVGFATARYSARNSSSRERETTLGYGQDGSFIVFHTAHYGEIRGRPWESLCTGSPVENGRKSLSRTDSKHGREILYCSLGILMGSIAEQKRLASPSPLGFEKNEPFQNNILAVGCLISLTRPF